MTHTPPSASAGGYPPDTERDATYLQPYATGGASPEGSPDTDEYAIRGHRSSRRPGPLRRLLRRREQPETEQADPLAPEADHLTRGSSWLPDEADDAEGRPPGYRAQHRARYPTDYPGAAPMPPGEDAPSYSPALGRGDSDQAAREHLSAFTPDDGTGSPWAEPGSWGPGSPPPGPFGPGRPAPGQIAPGQTAGQSAPGQSAPGQSAPGWPAPGPAGPGGSAPGGPAAGPGIAGPGLPGPGAAGPGPGPLEFPAGSAGMAGPGGASSAAAGQAAFGARPPGSPMPPAAMAPGPAFPAAPAIPAAPGAPAGAPVPPAAAPTDPLYRVLGGLAMRDLTLVESLLQVVEKLESHEEDPEQLELLFRIDHLATRMRRNSENLLVLAGHDTEGRDFEPVPLLDVARAAISEITDYSRAQVTSLPDVRVIGLAADDLSHILAELLDNATSKSPQSAAVVVRGERTGDGTLLVSVEDAGIGVPADRLADINTRLSRAPVLDASATRHMGLYVVGRLAHRHGIRVQLRERPYGGITAHIIIPDGLIRSAPGEPPARGGRPEHPLPRPRPQPSAPPSGPVPRPSSGPVSPSGPASPAAPPTPGVPGVPPAPRFQPADPATLPRRTPGQPAPANGMPVPGVTAPGEPAPPQRTPGQPAPAQPAPPQRTPGQPAPAQPAPDRPVTGQPPLGPPVADHPVADHPITGQPGPGQPGRPPSPVPVARESAAVPESGAARADRIRDELAGFQLGQRAARAGEAAPGNALGNTGPLRDPGPERPARLPGDTGSRPAPDLPVRPPGSAPARSAPDRPPRPADDLLSRPSPGRRSRPAPDLPARPAPDRPTRPGSDLPARPTPDRPTRPGSDRPSRAGSDRPARSGSDLPARSPGNGADRPPDTGSQSPQAPRSSQGPQDPQNPQARPGEQRWGKTGRPADEAGPETDET